MELGWSIVLETTGGPVAMWTGWLGNGLKIFYPYGVTISDELIMNTLGVTRAKPVAEDKHGKKKWAKFYSDRFSTLGRVWIDCSEYDLYGYDLHTIVDQRIVTLYSGHDQCNTIKTYDFTLCSEAQPDAPTTKSEYIQLYLNKFLELFVEVAKITGDITAINIESGLVLYTPKYLKEVGCELEEWTQDPTKYCYTTLNGYEVILYSGNSLVSWVTVLRREVAGNLSAEEIQTILDSLDNSSSDSIDIIPIIADMLEKIAIYG